MRALIWIITAIGTICAAAPAVAQTYDPNYPVCLQYARDGYIDCSYTSIPQCNATASGRGASAIPIHILRHARCQCGADVRPDFNWNRTATAMMGYR
jgi:hypothetical protein